MRRPLTFIAGLLLLGSLTTAPVAAGTVNFQQDTVNAANPLQVFVHTATDGTLGGKVTWQGACCTPGTHGLTLSIILVDHPGSDYTEIDNNGEACSVGGYKPLSCWVRAPAFEKGGSAPAGWYIVKVEQLLVPDETYTNVKLSLYGDIDQTAPGP